MINEVDVTNNHGECCADDHSSECLNKVIARDSLWNYFIYHWNVCPIFFIGSFQDACKAAFKPSEIKKRHPLLIYLHNDNSKWNHRFCSNILCSEHMIEYLGENYILWACDFTYKSDREILVDIWRKIFPNQSVIDFYDEQCPVLIGITRQVLRNSDEALASEYDFELLSKGNMLMRTNQILDLEPLLNELMYFKKEFDENEQNLAFSFPKTTGLCLDIVAEIAKYLSLNDVITMYNCTDVLPLMRMDHTNSPIIEPSDLFIRKIIQKIDPMYIVSLRIKATDITKLVKSSSPTIFRNINALTLLDLQQSSQIHESKQYFPNLMYLSLWYEKEVDFHCLCRIFNHIQNPIKRLEIRCGHILCSHRRGHPIFQKLNRLDRTIEYLRLDISYMFISLINNCSENHNTCLLKTIIDFIKVMLNIQYVYLIINKGNVERLLDVKEWKSLMSTCQQLKKVTLQISKNMSQNTQLAQKILDIQHGLRSGERTIEFKFKVK